LLDRSLFPSATPIQAKLTIGQPGDKYEQEADRIAHQVVQQIHAPVESSATIKSQSGIVQRLKDGIVRCQFSGGNEMNASPDLEASIQQARGSGQSLAESIREPMQRVFGADFSAVRVHTNDQSDQLNRSIQAKAFTTGQNIFFKQGAYQPGSRSGQELIAHELTHVIQQNNYSSQDHALSGLVQRAFRDRQSLTPDMKLKPVSTASSAHWTEKLAENYKNIANHSYGFSFAPKKQNEDDALEVNQFINAYEGKQGWQDPYQSIRFDNQVEPPKVRYNVHGSIYSTHTSFGQFYPLYGFNITRGRGASDMAQVLQERGKLTDERQVVLGQLYEQQKKNNWESSPTPYNQMDKEEKGYYITKCQEALGEPYSSLGSFLPGGIST
jgi:hypothetical protein